MNRKEITAALSTLLERDVLHRFNNAWASEVTLDITDSEPTRRVDYLAFQPANQSVSGIEHGEFFAYEVKSCVDDYKSGHGLNFIGDKNYLVTTADTYSSLKTQLGANSKLGVYIAIPYGYNMLGSTQEIYEWLQSPTSITSELNDWTLWCISRCAMRKNRKHSVQQLLFYMLRSGSTRHPLPPIDRNGYQSCQNCGEYLDDYGQPRFCPNCGTGVMK